MVVAATDAETAGVVVDETGMAETSLEAMCDTDDVLDAAADDTVALVKVPDESDPAAEAPPVE
jgi:hypothetical protein